MKRLKASGVILFGALAIAAGAQLSVPMVPVPTTLQTLAIVLLGLLAGPRLAMASAALYLGLVLAGVPLLSSGQAQGGRAFLQFLAAGYVVGFIPAAGVAGWLGRGRGVARQFAAGIAAHGVVFAGGVPVLAAWLGWSDALEQGLYPFIFGAIAKSAAAAGIALALRRTVD